MCGHDLCNTRGHFSISSRGHSMQVCYDALCSVASALQLCCRAESEPASWQQQAVNTTPVALCPNDTAFCTILHSCLYIPFHALLFSCTGAAQQAACCESQLTCRNHRGWYKDARWGWTAWAGACPLYCFERLRRPNLQLPLLKCLLLIMLG